MNRVWKNTLVTALYVVLAAVAVTYFYFASQLREKGKSGEVCKAIKVTLLDSSLNKFVTKEEIIQIIERFNGAVIGKNIDSIPMLQIENMLNHRSVVKESQIHITHDGLMEVSIRQRRPVIRIETAEGGFYVDETSYVFPLIPNYTSYVPVITGNIPVSKDSLNWINQMLSLGLFLEQNPFWNAQVEQIYFNPEGEVELCTRVGKERIILGDLSNLSEKFSKLYSYYKGVIPKVGWDKYETVNLKYKGQIVCTKKR